MPSYDTDFAEDGRRLQESGRSTLDQDRREPQRMATPRRHQQLQDEKPSVPPGND